MALDWQSLIAAIASFVAAILLIRIGYLKKESTAFAIVATLVSGVVFATGFIFSMLDFRSPLSQSITDFGWLSVAALLLVSLANFLREDKPPFARYPFFFTLLPLIVLPVFPFIADTVVIKNWVLALYQFGALMIAALLFTLMSLRDRSVLLVILAIAMFAIAWLTKWIIAFQDSGSWIYTASVIVGMILATKSFYDKSNHQPIIKTN
jgi:hypothetical protein